MVFRQDSADDRRKDPPLHLKKVFMENALSEGDKKAASPHWDCPRFSHTRGTLTKPRCIPAQSRDLSHFEACNRSSSPVPHVAQCHLTCAQCCRHCRGSTKEWVRAALRLQVGGQGTCAALCHPWFGKVKEVFFLILTTLHL